LVNAFSIVNLYQNKEKKIMIRDECFLCDAQVYAKDLCKKHYAQAYRLAKKHDRITLAIDLLVYKEAVDRGIESSKFKELV
jgi:hypothetical protein